MRLCVVVISNNVMSCIIRERVTIHSMKKCTTEKGILPVKRFVKIENRRVK
jgi:hypothetical protein